MQIYESITDAALPGATHLTIGNFDGVHRGHRAIIAAMRAAARAEGAACGLLTFHPHPRSVLRPDQPVATLSSLGERLELYAAAGLDFTIIHPFTPATAQTEAEDFLRLLHSHLGVRRLWMGPDFALGRNRRGDVAFLQEHGVGLGIKVEIIPEFFWEGEAIRSSSVRRLLELGNVEWAASWLGRHYAISGLVIHGAARGRSIGFPTANLSTAASRVIPANGVYATWVWLDDQRLPSVTNIGIRPTVNGSHRTVETHLIDFDGDLYGRYLKLEFVTRLRDETKFPDLQTLKEQIRRDRNQAATLLPAATEVAPYPRFEEIPHTADWCVRMRASSPPELYANAAYAMFALQGAAYVDGPAVEQYFNVEGVDREDLLVRWLSTLLSQAETQEVMFLNFRIEEITETCLRGTAIGRHGRSDLAHIKAVTYHNLSIHSPSFFG